MLSFILHVLFHGIFSKLIFQITDSFRRIPDNIHLKVTKTYTMQVDHNLYHEGGNQIF